MVGHYFPLPAETFILEQVNSLVELGHDVTVLVMIDGDPEAWDERSLRNGIPERVIDLSVFGRPLGGRLAPTLRGLVRSLLRHPRALSIGRHGRYAYRGKLAAVVDRLEPLGRFDAIHAFFGPAGITAECLRDIGLIDGPIVTSFLGYDITREIQLKGAGPYRRLFREAAELNPNSGFLRDRLLENGAPPERTRVHRLGIDLERFAFLDRSHREADVPLIAAVGRLVEKKGFEDLLRAVRTLVDRGVAFQLEIAGAGPLQGRLEAVLQELGLQDRVELLGWCRPDAVIELLRRADLFVVPSITAPDGDQEGLPLTMLEASATGLPSVGTRHSGIPEAIEDGVTGFLVEEGDRRTLADRIQALCEDRDRRAECGREARKLIEARFCAATQARELVRILREASGKSS